MQQNERDRDETPPAKRHRPTTSTYQQAIDTPTNLHIELENKLCTRKIKPSQTQKLARTIPAKQTLLMEENIRVTVDRKEQAKRRPAKIIIITEKIYDRTICHLKNNTRDKEILYLPNCTSIADLENKLASERLIRELIRADQIVILFGGTEIKRGTSGKELASRILDTVRTITRETITQVKVCELPPLEGDDKTRREREKFNEKIRELGQRCFKLNRVP